MCRLRLWSDTELAVELPFGFENFAAFVGFDHPHYIRHVPKLIGDASGHRRGDARGLMLANKIVVHEMDYDGTSVVLYFLAESVCEPRKPAAGQTYSAARLSRSCVNT